MKPSEGKREEFRKYLEKNGIMDALTKVLVNLYEEVDKPEEPLQYILDKLSVQAGQETHKELHDKLEEAQGQIGDLQGQLEQLQNAMAEPAPVEGEMPPEEAPPEEAPVEAEAPADQAPADQPPLNKKNCVISFSLLNASYVPFSFSLTFCRGV
ncbi:hypothetical protein NQ317_007488 [Molorchus minor]|uniref:c-Myc-binding protein n=1 Tax=Molorchus minor TaxID=1323400 RepID=A0ABQ9K0W2_9CUCU|nr:hypothetical protein NQ317_007488 [Molorchus minor]